MHLKRALTSTIFLKATSLIIGFLFWAIISDTFQTHIWVKVPLAVYNISEKKIDAPETILVELQGRRSHVRHVDTHTLAVHIDGHSLKPGPNAVDITHDLLFLPASITIGEIIPSNIVITREGDPSR